MGHAGVGKTAIAQTCVERLKELSAPCAAFFFGDGRDKPERLFPSIAYQLCLLFPDYRDLLDQKILHDKTLVKKSLRVQFQGLILEPLEELTRRNPGIKRRLPVFIDALEEVKGIDSQLEIIELIASAIHYGPPLLCWAFFSRPEAHIESAFTSPHLAPFTHTILLQTSREADKDIERYLRAGFEHILLLRNLPRRLRWPSDHDIQRLVIASHGLFGYSGAALRFIGNPQWLNPDEPLHLVLGSANVWPHGPIPSLYPFAELDNLYLMIMQRIPAIMHPAITCFLTFLCYFYSDPTVDSLRLSVVHVANCLAMSEMELRTICNQLGSVLVLQNQQRRFTVPSRIDKTRSYLETNLDDIYGVFSFVQHELGGSITFYHKTFLDFLTNPQRSGPFCVETPASYNLLLERLFIVHSRYDASYAFVGSGTLAPTADNSAISLSFPSTNEFVNSIIKASTYSFIHEACQDISGHPNINSGLRQIFAQADFRKALYIRTTLSEQGSLRSGKIGNCPGRMQITDGSLIFWSSHGGFSNDRVDNFKRVVKRQERAGILADYNHALISLPYEQRERGLFMRGTGSKSVFWYWEIDLAEESYRELVAPDIARCLEIIYKGEDLTGWLQTY
ncbi:hypothetical protein AN958_10699 [Leucoagaricus sp. SymC.cos]|nr:hypothetical protein AN958_10699 [Leucoagaricus sp. SymC.cos]